MLDGEKRFDEIKDKYLSLLNDQKFMTALCCLRGLRQIVSSRSDLLPGVMTLLMQHEKATAYPPRQEALFNADVLLLIQQNYLSKTIPPALIAFIEKQQTSQSPKTRKMAKAFF